MVSPRDEDGVDEQLLTLSELDLRVSLPLDFLRREVSEIQTRLESVPDALEVILMRLRHFLFALSLLSMIIIQLIGL